MAKYLHREQRVEQIADAALAVIAESGLRGFTTKAVAERVGITDGTIFRHFKSKQEIVVAAMERLEERMFAGGFPTEPDPLDRLEVFFLRRATMLGGADPIGRLMFSEQLVHAAGAKGRETLNAWREKNMRFVLECMKNLQDQGRLRPGLKPKEAARLFQGLLLTFAFERSLLGREQSNLAARAAEAFAALTVSLTS